MKYFSVNDWGENQISLTMDLCKDLFMFIESASQANGICMIMSVKNSCSTVAVASAYLIMKYKWSLKSAIDYISGIKADVFMSKSAFAQLVSIETSV